MIRKPSNSILNTIKGRIWLASTALAVTNCIFGFGAYLAVSFLVTDPFVTILVTFFVVSLITMVFGWWLSNDVIRPIENVTLLARSLERSPSATLPRTTGAAETDELLQTLHRGGQQMRNLIAVMDDVAAGKVDSALAPIEGADRLSASFQKLVAKVTDSITAKQDLELLQRNISMLVTDIAGIRNGKFDLKIRAESPQIKEIAETIRYLTNRLRSLALQVQSNSHQSEQAALDIRNSLQSAIDASDERAAMVSRNPVTQLTAGNNMEDLILEFGNDLAAARSLQDGFGEQGVSGSGSIERGAQLRGRVAEIVKKIQRLRTRSIAYAGVARITHELSKRSNLIALNISVVSGASDGSVGVLAAEIGSLSERAEHLQKQIAGSNEGLNSEIAELENDLTTVAKDIPDLVRLMSSAIQANMEFSTVIDRLSGLEQRFKSAASDHSLETDKISGLLERVTDASGTTAHLRDSELGIGRLIAMAETLRESVSDLDLPAAAGTAPRMRASAAPEPAELTSVPAAVEAT